tara:strand:- start:3900 stop:4862 length:963 start_codon:yes stop_codon:yes gene_type:complete
VSNFKDLIRFIRSEVNQGLNKLPISKSPDYLYNPIRYTLQGKGKRFRPILVHLSGRAFRVDPDSLMIISLAIEILHNFTLVHDDIMDQDSHRHGQDTLHNKWDESTAILAGDGLFALAQILLNNLPERANNICSFFNNATLEVCEGQAMDKEFENDLTISVKQYLNMIEKKTGALLGASSALPAILIDEDSEIINALDQFGRNLGMGFQIHDDLLEIYSDADSMGKSLGSDIYIGKQTLMVIMARENDFSRLSKMNEGVDYKNSTIHDLRAKFTKSGIEEKTRNLAQKYFEKARSCLATIEKIDTSELVNFIELVEKRSN